MKRFALALAGMCLVMSFVMSGQANAFTCTTTTVFASGIGQVDYTSLASPTNCVQAQDKLFGNFVLTNLPPGGAVNFNLNVIGGFDFHTISFGAGFQSGSSYSTSFDVAVTDPSKVIIRLDGDFSQSSGGPSVLTKQSTPGGNPATGINESKTGSNNSCPTSPLSPDECSILYSPGVSALHIAETLTDGGAISSIVDTIVEGSSVPEPGTLLLLGTGLVGLAGLARRRNRKR